MIRQFRSKRLYLAVLCKVPDVLDGPAYILPQKTNGGVNYQEHPFENFLQNEVHFVEYHSRSLVRNGLFQYKWQSENMFLQSISKFGLYTNINHISSKSSSTITKMTKEKIGKYMNLLGKGCH